MPASSSTDTNTAELTTVVFSKNDCPACTSTKRQFTNKGLPFVEINVELDTAPRDEFGGLTPLEHVIENYGRQMPVVVVTDDLDQDDAWSGARPDKIFGTIARFRDAGLLIDIVPE
ncbi:glutaredoxin-like protein NrdH [Plantibacter flavus]|uniref:Glutaredoxin n=1 Tax=Plantibacter flavus TaxID=150123 RepID=A0A3N2BL68_9MICO|nr:glutaredoxin family protein [Plantibacter flavus]ROR76027.1 glutaredoxin [Plantibacter flavus]SMG49157.1 glutaredoxin-like protein NrdH [Plantibacter flavus]